MRTIRVVALAVTSTLGVAACGGASAPATDATPDKVVLVAYDAFTPAEGIFDGFTADTGAKVEVRTGGDSGAVVNKAILTTGNPEGDVLWGIDNTMLSRAREAKVLDSYEPVDVGDVCINYSRKWYADRRLEPPSSMDDLVKPEYKDQLVVEDPVNSSPGLAFLLASVAKYGDTGWQDWWRALKKNGVKVVSDWTTAWTVEYAGGGNPGTRPLVVSYGSSPPAEMAFQEGPSFKDFPDSGVIESTCFRQTEYVGVLRGSRNPDNALALVRYLLERKFQESMPMSLFVYPVSTAASLPPLFTRWAVRAADPFKIDPDRIGRHRDEWLKAWRAIVL